MGHSDCALCPCPAHGLAGTSRQYPATGIRRRRRGQRLQHHGRAVRRQVAGPPRFARGAIKASSPARSSSAARPRCDRRGRRAAPPSRPRPASADRARPRRHGAGTLPSTGGTAACSAPASGHFLPVRHQVDAARPGGLDEGLRRLGRRLGEAAEAAGHGRALRAVDLHHHGVVAARPRRPAVGDHADRAALHLQQGVVGVLGIDRVALPAFVDPLGDGRGHQRADAGDRRHQPVDHVAPVRHHIERQPAALAPSGSSSSAAGIPARAVEDPRAGIDLHRQDAAEEARLA